MWGLNKNTPFVLVPKDLLSIIDLHDFASGFTPKFLYLCFIIIDLNNFDIYDYFTIMFPKLRVYSMSYILSLCIDDF